MYNTSDRRAQNQNFRSQVELPVLLFCEVGERYGLVRLPSGKESFVLKGASRKSFRGLGANLGFGLALSLAGGVVCLLIGGVLSWVLGPQLGWPLIFAVYTIIVVVSGGDLAVGEVRKALLYKRHLGDFDSIRYSSELKFALWLARGFILFIATATAAGIGHDLGFRGVMVVVPGVVLLVYATLAIEALIQRRCYRKEWNMMKGGWRNK